jgi:hypothetical protein
MSAATLIVVPDFWHKYDDSTPSQEPELEDFQQVWIYDETLGVNVGFWTGNGFRLYDRQSPVKPTHWAYLKRPPAPPATIAARAS